MTGARIVQCPHCGTRMDERARFCPGCWTPRSAVREQLERASAATGVPYAELLERETATYRASVAQQGGGWATTAAPPPPAVERSRRGLWIALGIVGGALLLSCVGCVIGAWALINRFDVTIGDDSPEAEAAQRQLELAAAGRHEERWEELHPGQRERVPVSLFITCAQHNDVDSIDVLGSFGADDSFIEGVGRVDSRVVFVNLSEGATSTTEFVVMVEVDGEWRWTLTNEELRDLELGVCP